MLATVVGLEEGSGKIDADAVPGKESEVAFAEIEGRPEGPGGGPYLKENVVALAETEALADGSPDGEIIMLRVRVRKLVLAPVGKG